MTVPSSPLRVLIVDDSFVMRHVLTQALTPHDDIILLPPASNGAHALRTIAKHGCDVVLLDMDMPLLDGLTALPLLTGLDPHMSVIVLSAMPDATDLTAKALQAGAAAYLAKPTSSEGNAVFVDALLSKIRFFALRARQMQQQEKPPAAKSVKEYRLSNHPVIRPAVLAIGCSTGGPAALQHLLRDLQGKIEQPLLITQHMPAFITTALARHLTERTGYPTVEAEDGMRLENGHAYLAPGDRHMVFRKQGAHIVVTLDDGPPVNHCRPSVDRMLMSLVTLYGEKVLAVLLTGMGTDGVQACIALHEQGGTILAQDEESSVVWGMPGAAAAANICSAVLPLPLLAQHILRTAHA